MKTKRCQVGPMSDRSPPFACCNRLGTAERLVTEGQILFNTISVGGVNHRGLPQRTTALGVLPLKQVAFSSPAAQDFAIGSNLETLADGLPGFISFGASHGNFLSAFSAESHPHSLTQMPEDIVASCAESSQYLVTVVMIALRYDDDPPM